jgi:hypothetical protein
MRYPSETAGAVALLGVSVPVAGSAARAVPGVTEGSSARTGRPARSELATNAMTARGAERRLDEASRANMASESSLTPPVPAHPRYHSSPSS